MRYLRDSLVKEGAIFRTTSDTETIVQLIAKSSEKFIDKLIDALFKFKAVIPCFIDKQKIGRCKRPLEWAFSNW